MLLLTIISLEAKEIAVNNTPVAETGANASQAANSRVKGLQAVDSRVRDLGVYGETFPIEEKSLLEAIKTKLQALATSGTLAEHQRIIAKKAKEQLNRPPVSTNWKIQKTTEPRSFDWDPTITVPYDLKDHKGHVFHRKGTKVNPLDTHSFRCPFLFVDGDDPEQVAWAIKQHQLAEVSHKPKIILVQGAPLKLSEKLNLPIYFDQSGVLVKKFGIGQVPARVSQKEKVLTVDEVNLTGERKHEH